MTQEVCIVTPDLVGPVKCGGIGTHCYHLAVVLAANGCHVTVLFTGPCEQGDRNRFRQYYSKKGVALEDLSCVPEPDYQEYGGNGFSFRSVRVMDYLARNRFGIVLFQDWQANGFAAIQAKRTGRGFRDTRLTVTLHSPAQWQREGMHTWPRNPIADAKLDFCERYCCENADSLISPSEYMFRWTGSKGWRLPADRRVLRNLHNESKQDLDRDDVLRDSGHIAFFGRLETRKGIEIFCRAVDSLAGENTGLSKPVTKVTFLGKEGILANGDPALPMVNLFKKKWERRGVSTVVITGYDNFQAVNYLSATGATAVLPSLLDNYPYTVLECLENNIPVLAARTGGIPEMVSDHCLFEPNWASLREALLDRESRVQQGKPLYSSTAAAQEWLGFIGEIESRAGERVGFSAKRGDPKVSVCIPYFNSGKFLPDCLCSLASTAYPNYEVIVVNDGSTDQQSLEVFGNMAERFGCKGWQFITQDNQGPGAARNRAASHATGEYLVFVDADNVAKPTMISDFVQGLKTSGADCLTCHFLAFNDYEDPTDKGFSPSYSYRPLGACLEVGLIENVFGDTNFCIDKNVFRDLGGFSQERSPVCEDWEFLARLCVRGFKLDVVPECLFFYRSRERGRSRGASLYQNHWFVLRAYLDSGVAPWVERSLSGLLLPYVLNAMVKGQHEDGTPNLSVRLGTALSRSLEGYPRLKGLVKKLGWRIVRILQKSRDSTER